MSTNPDPNHTWKDTHCKHGHEWTPENTYLYLDKNGLTRRKCRSCTLRRLDEKRFKPVKSTLRKTFKLKEGGDSARDNSKESMRVSRLLHLQEELERETRHWMRPEIQREIDKLSLNQAPSR